MNIMLLIAKYWPYLALPILSNAAYAHISYSAGMNRSAWWYIGLCMLCSLMNSASWGLLMRVTTNSGDRFILGQVSDFIPILFFCVLPPFIYAIGLNGWRLWAGILLIVIGTFLIGYSDRG